MTDRELLESAAKAAGITLHGWSYRDDAYWIGAGESGAYHVWAPLTDDGDALRLAVTLRLELDHNHLLDNEAWVMALQNGKMVGPTESVEDESGRFAATRRAIVRAAAAIGQEADRG